MVGAGYHFLSQLDSFRHYLRDYDDLRISLCKRARSGHCKELSPL